ncbi:amino acid ABC transporter permease [Desulfovermiculus halophilus]|jgi:polar amino acid transport system permease protein|uniref:amino acid ABC transporter permease n=1 Tax=Desulfovermiculus halophilus TaxID=339722 RepID=UPI0005596E44|nr:amino acid ABC transporter permease [Desulfovermiculus halophilus]
MTIQEFLTTATVTWESIPTILSGLTLTLEIIFITLSAGFVMSIPIASIQVYSWRPLAVLMFVYERIIRGIPVMFSIFLIYFGAPYIGIELNAFISGVLALSIRSSAYQSQIFRGSIQSVGKDQIDAAESLGMGKLKVIRKVVLPQALRRAIPAWSNEWSTMVKDSSLVYVLGVVEMMTRAKMIVDRTGVAIPIFLTVALFYLIITASGNKFLRYLEFKLAIPGVTTKGFS